MAADLKQLHVEYHEALKAGQKGKARLIEGQVVRENYGLVRKLVGKLIRRLVNGFGGDESDLMQAGAIGLLRGWQGWKPERGAFSTYVGHWVRHEVQEALGDDQAIYNPRQMGKPWPVHKAQEAIRAKTGREATAEDLVDACELTFMAKLVGLREKSWPAADAPEPEKAAFRDHVVDLVEKLIEKWRQAPAIQSLDDMMQGGTHDDDRTTTIAAWATPARERADRALIDKAATPAEAFERAQLAALVQKGFEKLTPIEQYIMQSLFIEEKPYKTIANALDISEEWVRQHRASALEKLRSMVES